MTVVGGAYELLALVGSGGMGAVWRARQLSLGRAVAVKLLLSEEGDDEPRRAAARRLRDEARAAARVAHPDLVSVLDTGEDAVLGPFIVYELLEGGSLRDRLERGELGWDLAFEEVGRPLLDGLAALHDAGMVHRDVKPENIIAGSDGRFRLGDFGLALFEGRQARTADGSFVGTPGYLAPERIIGASVGTPSDVYAAAVVLVEAATGRLPFRGTSVAEMVREQAVRSPSPSALTGLGLPATAAAVLASALVREPERRPGAAELLGRLVAPSPSVATEVLRRPALPRPRRGATATVASSVVPPASPRRRRLLLPLLVLLACLTLVAVARWPSAPSPAAPPTSAVPSTAGHDDPELCAQALAWVEQFEDMRKLLREARVPVDGLRGGDPAGRRRIEAYVRRGDEILARIEAAKVDGSWPGAARIALAMHAALVARFDAQLDMSMLDLYRQCRPIGLVVRTRACAQAEALLAAVSEDLELGSLAVTPGLLAGYFEAVGRLVSAVQDLPERVQAVAETRRTLERALGRLAPLLGVVDLAQAASASDEARVGQAELVPGLVRNLGRVLLDRAGGFAAAARMELGVVQSLVPVMGAAVREGIRPSILDEVAAESLGFVTALERRDGPSPEMTAARISRAVLLLDLGVMAADKTLREWRGRAVVRPPGRREFMAARLVAASTDLMPSIRLWMAAAGLPPPLRDEVETYLAEVDKRRQAVAKVAPASSDPRVLETTPADPAALGPWAVGIATLARGTLDRIKALAADLTKIGRGEGNVGEADRLVCLSLYRRATWALVAACALKEGRDVHLRDLSLTAGDTMTMQDYLSREDGSLFGLDRRLITLLAAAPLEAAVRSLAATPEPGPELELYVLQSFVKLLNRAAVGGPADLLEGWHAVLVPTVGPSTALSVLQAVLYLESRSSAEAAPLMAAACKLVLARAEAESAGSEAEAALSLECLGHLLDGWASLGVGGPYGRGEVLPEADGELENLVRRCEGILLRWRKAGVVRGEQVRFLAAHLDVYRAGLELRRSVAKPPRLAEETMTRLRAILDDAKLSGMEGRCRRLLAGEDIIRIRIVEPLDLEVLTR